MGPTEGSRADPAQLLWYRTRHKLPRRCGLRHPEGSRNTFAATPPSWVMRWKKMVRDGTWDGPSYEAPNARSASGCDQAVARTAAGTRRSFRAWSCPTSALR